MNRETAVWDVLVPEAEKYCAERQELTLTIGVTHGGERSFKAFRSPDAKHAAVPNEKSVYEIGSVSKVFTAALLAVMESKGTISLDDNISTYLPDLDLKPDIAEITVFDLATHTAGMSHVGKVFAKMVDGDVAALNEAGHWPTPSYYHRYRKEDLYEELRIAELARPRQSGWEYSIIGLSTLGHLLELAAGRPYEALLTELLCEPLGLHDTLYNLSDEQLARVVHGYDENGGPSPVWYWDVMLPQGGLRSTLDDMLTFAEANLRDDGSGLFEALARARHTHFEWPEGYALAETPDKIPPPFRQALGWRSHEGPGGTISSHQGATLSYQSALSVCENTQTGFVVLTSSAKNLQDVMTFPVVTTQWMHKAQEALAGSTT